MKTIIEPIVLFLQSFVSGSSMPVGILVGMGVIILESIFPMLPLALFIALNVITFGSGLGFFMSWVATILGCTLAFFFFRFIFYKKWNPKWSCSLSFLELIDKIDHISFPNLVMIMAFPFTPAFSINIGAGISKMSYQKFFLALLISKAVIVYFWGFIGTSLLESLKSPMVLIKISSLLVGAFLLSKLAMKNVTFN